jgi:ABC-type uncharacterized transport system YnjBCD substrate-binding protein
VKKIIVTIATVLLSLVAAATAQDQPKVFIEASSAKNGTAIFGGGNARNQAIEMSKDFQKQCPEVKITIKQDAADYTVILNHLESGLIARDNQIEVADKDGSLITTREKGSIKNQTRFACELILNDFAKNHPKTAASDTPKQ